MVDGTTTTATTTTANMLGLTADTNTNTTQGALSNMSGSRHKRHSSIFALSDSWTDEANYPCPALEHLSSSDDSDADFVVPSSQSAKLRLPSGKTISRKTNGPHTSKHRSRRTPSPNTIAHLHHTKKVQGNCAMIPNSATAKNSTTTQKPRLPPTPLHSDSDSEPEQSSLVPRHQFLHNSLAPHIRLPTHRTTIRNSDAQMLATLPVSTQRTLLATTKKAVGRAGREEQEYRRKLDGYGNLKSKERFVNDVPGGKSHKNRFMAQ